MLFYCTIILIFNFVIFVNASLNTTLINSDDDVVSTLTNSPGSDDLEELPKQEPFTWLLPSFIRKNIPFLSPEESEPPLQERRRFDQDVDRRNLPNYMIPKEHNVLRRKTPQHDLDKTISRKHPSHWQTPERVPTFRLLENSYLTHRPNIRQRIPADIDDNEAQESSVNAIMYERVDNSHGSLQSALKSLWEYKKKAYRNLLANSEAYERVAGNENEARWNVEPSSPSEWPKDIVRESPTDHVNFIDPLREVFLDVEKISKLSRAPDEVSEELQSISPIRRTFERIPELPRRNPNLRRDPDNSQDLPPRLIPSRRNPEIPRRIRISNTRRISDVSDDPPRAPFSGRKPSISRRERFPEDISSNQREIYALPSSINSYRRTPLSNRESIARNSNIDNNAYYEDYINDQSPITKSESSGRWPRSMQLVRPRDPKSKTNDHRNHLDDDSYFLDLTILDDEGFDKRNEAYAYYTDEDGHVINEDKSVKPDMPSYDWVYTSENGMQEDPNRNVGSVTLFDNYATGMSNPLHSSLGIHAINSNDEIEEIEYVDMYEEDFKKVFEDNSVNYELEEVVIPDNISVKDEMSFSDFYHRQGSVRIPGSVTPQPKKTIRMKISPGKNSGKKIIKMKIRGLDGDNVEEQIGDQQSPEPYLKQTPNSNRQFNNKQQSSNLSSQDNANSKKATAAHSSGADVKKNSNSPTPSENSGRTPKPKGYSYPPANGGSNFMPPGKGGKKPNFLNFGGKKTIFSGLGGTKTGGKKPIFSGFGGMNSGGAINPAGFNLAGGFNEAGIKNAFTSTFQQASGIIPDLSKAITVMSFLAFSVFVANLGVNALANSSLGVSFGRESDSPWSLNKSAFKIEDMIHNLDKLLEGSREDSKTAVESFEAVVDLAENVYNEFHKNIGMEVGNLSEKINNYLENNFSEEGLPIGDISKKYLLIEDTEMNDLNINCYRRLLCLSHQLTLKLNISDSRNKMLPFWTFGIGWLKGGQDHVATLLENLRAELAGQSGRNCNNLYSQCDNSLAVENYVKETELQLKTLITNKTKWEAISSSTPNENKNLKKNSEIRKIPAVTDADQQNYKVSYNYDDKNEDKFKLVHKSTISRVTIQKSKK